MLSCKWHFRYLIFLILLRLVLVPRTVASRRNIQHKPITRRSNNGYTVCGLSHSKRPLSVYMYVCMYVCLFVCVCVFVVSIRAWLASTLTFCLLLSALLLTLARILAADRNSAKYVWKCCHQEFLPRTHRVLPLRLLFSEGDVLSLRWHSKWWAKGIFTVIAIDAGPLSIDADC